MRFHFQAITGIAFGLAAAVTMAGAEIVGGKSVSITAAPWQVWIGNCGGTWVGGRNIITAQHCVNGSSAGNITVTHGVTRRSNAPTANRVGVSQIIKIAPSTDLSRDMAILKLSADIPASSLARPIKYATGADATAGYTDRGKQCMATGWGKLSPSLPLADSLQQVFSVIQNTATSPSGVIRWAGQGGSQHIGSCQGDSGGPLVVRGSDGQWMLAGVSSYIQSFCGDPNSPSSYARVSAFTSWLVQNGVPQPSTTPVLDHLIAPRLEAGFFRLTQAQDVAVTVSNLNGSKVLQDVRFFAAGRHALPSLGLPAGAYILRLRGKDFDITQRLPLL